MKDDPVADLFGIAIVLLMIGVGIAIVAAPILLLAWLVLS